MIGDEGPYMDPNGPDVWVPRTVSYLKAREIAKQALDYSGDRIEYVGKSRARLLGFTRNCLCEEACEGADERDDTSDPCMVPAWHFRTVER